MPVDRYHSFGNAENKLLVNPDKSPLPRPLLRLTRYLRRVLEHMAALEAVDRFREVAILGHHCRIGSRAWCVNRGAYGNIQLGNYVVCRGLLRCENFHPGTIIIGDYVYIGDDCVLSCAERIEIGAFTLLAHGVQIFDNDSHPVDAHSREQDFLTILGQHKGPRDKIARKPITIGERAWIGMYALIMKGVQIGEGSIVASGSVVTADVPPFTLVAGNPARIVKEIPAESTLIPS
jgi:acetyltransferase-like isoleucine patch superfamily enzyme